MEYWQEMRELRKKRIKELEAKRTDQISIWASDKPVMIHYLQDYHIRIIGDMDIKAIDIYPKAESSSTSKKRSGVK